MRILKPLRIEPTSVEGGSVCPQTTYSNNLTPRDPTLNLTRDLIRRPMVVVRIMPPANKKGARANFPHAIHNRANRALGLFALTRDKAIWEPEEKHILRIEPQVRTRPFCFLLAERYQPLWRIGFAVRMGASAVADDDNLSTQSLSARVGDQTPAAKAFIVWMRRDNDERPILERLTQRAKRERPERRSRVR